ncbi:beta-hexosaminidase A precursor [bacterium BMS3Abin01]|nr:beta-hexosaminidase A precursor [bacterium BMS3Abin01]HDY69517.1 hypothetical protein [Actinomycetota bacterium]
MADDGKRESKQHTAITGKRTDRYAKKGRRQRKAEKGRQPVTGQQQGDKKLRKAWYRRPLVLVPAIIAAAALAGGAFALWYTGNLDFNRGQAEAGDVGVTASVAATVEQPVLTPEQQEVAEMTLEQKVGQMMMVGFEGQGMGDEVTALVQTRQVGALLLKDRNIDSREQVAGLVNALQETARQAGQPAKLMIAIEQEGGKTRRFDSIGPYYSEPMIGEMGDIGVDVAGQQASSTARDLKSIGINTNLAPVIDVSDGWGSVMNVRSYGMDPQMVADMGVMAVRGYNKTSVISCPSHFPGQGSADSDPEDGLPYVYTSRELLDQYELLPFNAVVQEGAPMIMVGHLVVPALDANETPASMSRPIMTDLLRRQMGFTGVIITDDLELAAIADNMDVGEAAVTAVNAGADMVIVARTYDEQVAVQDALVGAVKSGRLTGERIDESVLRILKMKKKFRLETG